MIDVLRSVDASDPPGRAPGPGDDPHDIEYRKWAMLTLAVFGVLPSAVWYQQTCRERKPRTIGRLGERGFSIRELGLDKRRDIQQVV